jgi:LysM repeat protein
VRSRYARIAAPAAFLAAATIAVLLVRGAIYDDGSGPATTIRTIVPTTARTTTASTPRKPTRRYYRIQSGDTFGSIALRFDISVERLLELNPGVDPSRLRVGQRIRVR